MKKSKNKKINKSTVKRGVEVLSAMQDKAEENSPEPAKAVGLSLEVQQKLSKNVLVHGIPVNSVINKHGRRVSGVDVEFKRDVKSVPVEASFKFKILCGSGVEVEVAGDMSHLFGVIDRYAGKERIPLDMKRYGISANVRPRVTTNVAALQNLDKAIQNQA